MVDRTMLPVNIQVCPNPLFVLGSPRSGTTILGQSLGTHPLFHDLGETQIIWDLFGGGQATSNYRREGRQMNSSWLVREGIDRPDFLATIGIGVNALLTSVGGGRRWIDQTPLHARIIDVLGDMFPGAQFLHIFRDPRTTIHSMLHYASRFDGKVGPTNPWAKDFSEACKLWCQCATPSVLFEREHPDRCLRVRYEELVSEPERIFAAILQFLEAPDDPSAATYFRTTRVNSSFPNGLGRPKDGREAWEEWSDREREIFLREVVPVLLDQGATDILEDLPHEAPFPSPLP